MRRNVMQLSITGFLVCLLAIPLSAIADTQWNVGVSGGNNGIEGFYISIGNYFNVPEREVVVIHNRGIDEEELPVAFYIAQRAHVRSDVVVNMRLRGMRWMDIALHFGLGPEIFYVPVNFGAQGPPNGHAYGYYKHHPRGGWRKNDLRDEDIVNQVNLKFISEHYKYAPDKVMRYRSEGKRFATIDQDIRYGKQGRTPPQIRGENRPRAHYQDQGPVNYRPKDQSHTQVKGPGKGQWDDGWKNQGKGQGRDKRNE